MSEMIKNIGKSEVMAFAEQVTYLQGQVVSKTLAQNPSVNMTLFAFDKGEEISTHESGGDALVIVLDGKGKVTIDGKEHFLAKGESIVMPAKVPHAVYAPERFKMLLIVIFPKKELVSIP